MKKGLKLQRNNMKNVCFIVLCYQVANPPKPRIKITKKQYDRINNRFILSFPTAAPNNRFKQDMIVLSYPIFLKLSTS